MTDTLTPTGPDGIAMHKLRRMVSKSATFQARSRLSEDELFDRCCYVINRDFDQFPRPFYIIAVPPGGSRQGQVAGGGRNYLLPGGTLSLLMEIEPNADYTTDNDQVLEASDFFSNVMADIAENAAADDSGETESFVDIHRMYQVDNWQTPFQTAESTGVFFGAMINCEWGQG